MDYVYVPSYGSLFYALYLVKNGIKTTVISNNKGIRDYCLNKDIKCIYFENIPINLRNIRNIRILKEKTRSIIEKIPEESRVYVLFRYFDVNGFYLIKELSKKTRVYHTDIDSNLFSILGPIGLKRFIDLGYYKGILLAKILRILLDLDLTPKIMIRWWMMSLSDNFYARHNMQKMEFDKPYQEIKLEVIDKFSEKQEGCDTLLLIEVPEVEEFVDYKHLQFIYKRLFEAGLDIKIKYHPPEKRDELIKNDIEGYPTEIPGEFLLKNVKSNVVSLYSLSLITA